MEHLISAVIFLPLLGVLFALFASERLAKWICTAFAVAAFIASVPLATNYRSENAVPLNTFYEKSILPKAFQDHGITDEVQKKRVRDRLRAEKDEAVVQ